MTEIGKGDLVEIKITGCKSKTYVCVDIIGIGDQVVYSFIDCITNESWLIKEYMLFWNDYIKFVVRNKSDLSVDV